ncbi:outer membrane protein assembly factor BamA [Acinetobacter gyllenbergii]|uniref:Outer membrane protein assembly factor BamA n=1 Tax=Acinetobacter gyllenbergii CIP 110306 = MTCC 11365 TaxID=1217657 RepID=A0A829HJ50_9GAMM|nr:outer membrane protein assembly factor BamA [Acinetobacter gyllenbergii]EPF87963.1 outer membrane protein assembly complex, YaeT protein [Acinetobacter gyllenbergii CIP 110306 = MTCC 11365]EPH35961.1 Outer membrane protein assembly factor YaeT precursor [Acinetobacter gyllenbergii CIP 110306 = MTCC 11365]ESK55013.1 outer membrane protein assembly complex, YaeT protein [Acinetobacter gyllenbergii NIPH 230]GMA12533.1 outer membrane protein assembly factor BamA [Acinetobacter gyllenbergii]
MGMRHTHLLMPLALVSAMAVVQQAYAADEFLARDIRIDGLVRLTPASIYSMLPINSGDRVSDPMIAEAIRTLYASGLFDDIKTYKENDVLVFRVVERPVISKLEFKGNKLIPKEALEQGLKKMGIAEGEVFKKSALQTIETELEQQYTQQGRYDADVTVETVARPNNRVELKLNFNEGTAAKVFDINIIGNTVFSDSDIKQAFAVKESGWASIVTRNDRYAREKMAASLEALRALYLNKGYINFNIINSQLNISEDKKHIFIEVSVDEGSQFKFGETKFLGDALYKPEELQMLKLYKDGETYSQERVNAVKQLLLRKYGNAGYYYAEVNVVPEINNQTGIVNLNYYINPGQQVTVRRINFTGNSKTADEVLRREMRQMEGALASNEKIDLSKVRLERTGFFKTVDVKPVRVPNSPDEVDLNVNVEEQHSGTTTLAVGYSQNGGVTFQAGLSQTNFMGTGNRVAIDLSRSETQDYYNLSVTDPYFTIDGVSRGYNVYYRKTKLNENYNVNNYVTDSIGGSLSFGYPIDENQSLSASLGIDQTKVRTGPSVSTYIRDYLLANGGKATGSSSYCPTEFLETDQTTGQLTGKCQEGKLINYDNAFEGTFLTYNLNLGWSYNTLNRPIFPTSGMSHRVGLEIGLPGSDVDYQKMTYDAQAFKSLWGGFVLRGYGKLGYGNDLPFYKNFYAGGYGSVRGYDNSSLGPRYPSVIFQETKQNDLDPEEVGGNALVQFGTELALPLPFKGDWTRQVRPVLFAEGAQVFDTQCDVPKGNVTIDGKEVDIKQYCKDNNKLDFGNMRYSVGVGFTWITMIGPLSLSYAFPLNDKKGDDTKSIQFEIGRTF